ncbi:tRNA guanosine(34) transglycosylase Tgt [Candidatus Protochlamydia phocaeensis]|uniref:tRNA guanosine(34) transglycosylase Tgt n=1 Tax=Candidatus Protochlamydia phocaeensis TaxID=1414722 RepID=UPI00083807BF|nr:tRNA guanosine(34) transglycosylase Tgt [Candidatus Protochlamydia phocaeensis]
MSSFCFNLLKKDGTSRARLGLIETAHGSIETPAFMPVGTRGSVKTLTQRHLLDLEAPILVVNAYHIMLRPGLALIQKAGGLHAFMRWPKPILTDSGGFQVASLSHLNRAIDEGLLFQSHIDGTRYTLGPRESMEAQKVMGGDIVMTLDACLPYPSSYEEALKAVERSYRWAKQCRDCPLQPHQGLFAIIHGQAYAALRQEAAHQLSRLPFEGFAIGGLSVGVPAEIRNAMIEAAELFLPIDKPRYLMGVGTPRNIIEAVMRGVDLFDCVMPTRAARHGTAFTWSGKIPIKGGRYARDFDPLDAELKGENSQYSKAYIHHLLNVGEITGLTLVSLQNLAFYLDFMQHLRQAICQDELQKFYQRICEIYPI